MHNSLHIRDLLRKTNSDPLRVSRRDPHHNVMRDPASAPVSNAFELTGEWAIRTTVPSEIGRLIVADLADFLGRMDVQVVPGTSTAGQGAIQVRLALDLGARDLRNTIQPGMILIEGGDVAGLWAGVTWLEHEMRDRRGPYLSSGHHVHRAAWPIQISQGPWGGNYSVPDFSPEYLSDDSFRLYAHYDVNSIPDVFSCYLYYLQELDETFSHRQIDETKTCLVLDRLPNDARSLIDLPHVYQLRKYMSILACATRHGGWQT
jgi:hypothetical protein